MLFIGLLYACVVIAGFVFNFYHLLWGWFNPVSILIVAIYALSILKTPKTEESDDEEEIKSKLSIKQIIILFITFSALLIAMSIGITYHTNWIVQTFGFGETFGGALFLGVATSLPELTSTINLCKKKNFDAAYGNILGSCVFNFFILGFADVLSFNAGPLYNIDQSSFLLIVGGAIALIVFLPTLLLTFLKKTKPSIPFRIIYLGAALIIVSTYIAFLILSNINLGLGFAPFVVGE